MSRYCLSILILLVLSLFLLASPALALSPLVPCGNEGQPLCTTCDFLVLGKNISDFILVYLVPAIAALLFVYAGFEILLGGGIPARVAKGRAIFQTTAYGIAIIFLAWLIVNTVIRTVAQDENIAEHWWELECRESISTTTTPTITPTPTTSQSLAPSTTVDQMSPTPTPTPTTLAAALICPQSNINLCQPSTAISSTFCGFSSSACSRFNGATQRAASALNLSGLNSAALVKSFIINESSCNIDAYNSIRDSNGILRESCGPMQMQASTANTLKQFCGITANITCSWLRNSANIDGIVCLGAQYIKSLSSGTCGTSIRNIAAGYNGGVGACSTSRDCSSERSCDNSSVRRWECLYDNTAHTVCNEGYNETRVYAPKVIACYNANNR